MKIFEEMICCHDIRFAYEDHEHMFDDLHECQIEHVEHALTSNECFGDIEFYNDDENGEEYTLKGTWTIIDKKIERLKGFTLMGDDLYDQVKDQFDNYKDLRLFAILTRQGYKKQSCLNIVKYSDYVGRIRQNPVYDLALDRARHDIRTMKEVYDEK